MALDQVVPISGSALIALQRHKIHIRQLAAEYSVFTFTGITMNKMILGFVPILCAACSPLTSHESNERILIPHAGDMVPVRYVAPAYPADARETGTAGWVLVEFTVSEEGIPENVQVIESEPDDLFDQSAVDATNQLVYLPKIKDGRLVAVSGVQYRFIFSQNNDGED